MVFQRVREIYARTFRTAEIDNDSALRLLYWALLAGFFISFIYWAPDKTITVEAVQAGLHTCLPYFQSCGNWIFLKAYDGFTPQLLYAILTLTLVGSALCALSKKWDLAHALLWPASIWKFIYLGLLAGQAGTDYEYFHLPVLFVFLLSANKVFFSRIVFIFVYLGAATAKFDSSWIAGSYFSSVKYGLPLFSDSLIPFITNGVAIFEIFSPFALLSKNPRLRVAVLGAWIVFHAYSVQMVDFRYPLHCLTVLIALFWTTPRSESVAWSPQNIWSYAVIASLLVLTILPTLIPGDTRYNLKSMKLGVRMFDANHQCFSILRLESTDQSVREIMTSTKSAMKRCAPYPIWFRAKQICNRSNISNVGWEFLTSINGGPFFRSVNAQNICNTEYQVFSKNYWFSEPEDGAQIAGYPTKNHFVDDADLPRERLVFPDPVQEKTSVEKFLLSIEMEIAGLYWFLWSVCVSIFLFTILKRSLRTSSGP